VHPTGQKSKKCPEVNGHVFDLSARHAKVGHVQNYADAKSAVVEEIIARVPRS
jgi:hypothetical protein